MNTVKICPICDKAGFEENYTCVFCHSRFKLNKRNKLIFIVDKRRRYQLIIGEVVFALIGIFFSLIFSKLRSLSYYGYLFLIGFHGRMIFQFIMRLPMYAKAILLPVKHDKSIKKARWLLFSYSIVMIFLWFLMLVLSFGIK